MTIKRLIGLLCLVCLLVLFVAVHSFFADRESVVKEIVSPDGKSIAVIRRIQRSQWGSEPDVVEVAIGRRHWLKTVVARLPYESHLEDFNVSWLDPAKIAVLYPTDATSRRYKTVSPATGEAAGIAPIGFVHTATWIDDAESGVSEVLSSLDSVHQVTVKVEPESGSGDKKRLKVWLQDSQSQALRADTAIAVYDEAMCSASFLYGVRWRSAVLLDLYIPGCDWAESGKKVESTMVGNILVRRRMSDGSSDE
ncbi:hypothetical protein FTW19_06505 [Terriglobus albidus]|uniref:Uncharacterized protein n=1 Tax=Terriglobus albidus TaxID=1592106 RepID=A0A5B9E7Y3_9BACT|nr:hypothetical protein [Terriglobus albidus]QEE27674.1 hypothetical protein FTW19_06505 [Terriglobus albidus]